MSDMAGFSDIGEIERIISDASKRVHLIGAGGVSMYSLLCLSLARGINVTGSDRRESELLSKLLPSGRVSIGHSKENVRGKDLAVFSLAVPEDNPELRFARESGIPTVSRAQYMAALTEPYKTKISVSGSHGKSTSVAMLSDIFAAAKKDPTVLSGALLGDGKEPYIFGGEDFLIFEACEYRDAFLSFFPDATLVTGLELDHVDYFKSLDDIKRSFSVAMARPRTLVINGDDENLVSAARGLTAVTFGLSESCDFFASDISSDRGCYSFSVFYRKKMLARIALGVFGMHNLRNALGAFAIAYLLGIDAETAAAALSSFSGIPRRMELITRKRTAPVYYDYAHHPSEIRATLSTLRETYGGKITAVFRPHTYSRTIAMLSDFAASLSLADRVILLEIDGIREKNESGVSSLDLAELIGDRASVMSEDETISELLGSDSLIALMGAADVTNIKNKLVENNRE